VNSFLKSIFSRPAAVPDPEESDWQHALALPICQGLSETERQKLVALAKQLLKGKTFTPAADAEPTGLDIAMLLIQAALPVLYLGTHWYKGWSEVVLYPGEFVHKGEQVDQFGVVHGVVHVRAGEAWAGGPLVLSLESVRASGNLDGYNVVVHEFAHKLDMNNGPVNGLPPLHGDMRVDEWSSAFTHAYRDFCRQVAWMGDNATGIDPYAAESPAEFFAVMSEYFFERPDLVLGTYPAVYEQMRRFYRQDPLQRLALPS